MSLWRPLCSRRLDCEMLDALRWRAPAAQARNVNVRQRADKARILARCNFCNAAVLRRGLECRFAKLPQQERPDVGGAPLELLACGALTMAAFVVEPQQNRRSEEHTSELQS